MSPDEAEGATLVFQLNKIKKYAISRIVIFVCVGLSIFILYKIIFFISRHNYIENLKPIVVKAPGVAKDGHSRKSRLDGAVVNEPVVVDLAFEGPDRSPERCNVRVVIRNQSKRPIQLNDCRLPWTSPASVEVFTDENSYGLFSMLNDGLGNWIKLEPGESIAGSVDLSTKFRERPGTQAKGTKITVKAVLCLSEDFQDQSRDLKFITVKCGEYFIEFGKSEK